MISFVSAEKASEKGDIIVDREHRRTGVYCAWV